MCVEEGRESPEPMSSSGNNEDSPAAGRSGISKWSAVGMTINLYLGAGLVTIPAAMATGGYFSVFFLAAMGVVAGLTGLQLVQGFNVTGSESYYDYAEAVGGRWLRLATQIIICAFFIVAAIQMQMLAFNVATAALTLYIEETPTTQILTTTVAAALPLILVGAGSINPKALVRVGTLASAIVFLLIICIIASCSATIHDNRSLPEAQKPELTFFNPATSLGVMAVAAMNYAGHGGLPDIYRRMEKPEQEFSFVVKFTFTFMTCVYCGIGLLAYTALGNQDMTYADVLDYIPLVWKTRDAKGLELFAMILFFFKLVLTQPVLVQVAVESVEPTILHWIHTTLNNTRRLFGSVGDSTFGRRVEKLVFRSCYFLIIIGASLLLANYGGTKALISLVAFVGAFLVMPETYLFPSAFLLFVTLRPRMMLSRKKSSRLSTTTTAVLDVKQQSEDGDSGEKNEAAASPKCRPNQPTVVKRTTVFLVCLTIYVISVTYFIQLVSTDYSE